MGTERGKLRQSEKEEQNGRERIEERQNKKRSAKYIFTGKKRKRQKRGRREVRVKIKMIKIKVTKDIYGVKLEIKQI